MGPVTRLASAKAPAPVRNSVPSSSFLQADDKVLGNDDSTDEENVEEELVSVRRGVAKLCNKVSSLRQRNRKLRGEIEALQRAEDMESTAVQPKRGRTGASTANAMLKGKVKELESQVRRLEKARAKDKKKVEQLKMKEIRAEAEDLEDQGADSSHSMRKLLRRFHDTMLATSLENEAETCLICLDSVMTVDNCSSLHCQHIFCNDCLSRLLSKDPSSHSISCPQCRELCARDEVEVVQYTAQQQWDELLGIAQEFAKMYRRGEMETSEEEAEEAATDDFIADETSSASSALTPLEHDEQSYEQAGEEGTNDGRPSTPSRAVAEVEKQLYSRSPVSAKRQRMVQLMAERSKKRRT